MHAPVGPAPLDLNRPRNLGDLLSATFSLYGRYFGVFAAIAFAVVVPVDLVFYGGMMGWFGELRLDAPSRAPAWSPPTAACSSPSR